MKRLSLIMVCLFAMMAASTGLKAQEISILLRPGWNWIGYPYPETVDLGTAFGDFEPLAGDVIESSFGYSEYISGYGWYGGVNELRPGWGYMYYSNRTETVTIVFSPSSPPVEPITVTTAEPTDITANSAVSGGSITSNDGNYIYVFQKGICWAIHPNPLVMNDSYTENGSGAESFTAEMTDLIPNTVYYVRAYAVTLYGTTYGDELSFNTLDVPMPPLSPVGIIDGTFTVNANGAQVYFSQGNLQYQASTNTWQFAEHQWDYIGSSNSNISSSYNGWIDLFGWGTSGYDHGAMCYQPWSTSENYDDYNIYGSAGYNLYDQTGQADWGYNLISNGGNTENTWRTLTQPEWEYLFNTRVTSSGVRFAKAIVNNVEGVILLPDDWSSATYNFNNANNTTSLFNSNVISSSQWVILENAGSVFLPAAGWRIGTSFNPYDDFNWGCYWSSTLDNPGMGCAVLFNYQGLYPNNATADIITGNSVRLVTPMQPMVTTNGVTGITETTAISGGHITNSGFYVVTECGICWSTEPNPTVNDNVIIANGVSTGEFTMELNNLVSNTCYYVRAYAINSKGVGYGREMRFITAGGSGGGNAPTGAINGLFSVDASSQVYFSQGNLQYRPSTNTWRFAYDQNSYIGSANSNISPTYYGWVDLFSWGTGDDPTNTNGNDVFVDWGNNPISNGGNTPNTWRTLTRDEWDYIFNIRSTTMGVRYAKAQVEGVNGVVLLPDNWSISTYNLINTNNNNVSYSTNEITALQWIILENAGAVFLPAAGFGLRYNTGYRIQDDGEDGFYWSSIPHSCLGFSDYYLFITNNFSGTRGQSVRLVYSAE